MRPAQPAVQAAATALVAVSVAGCALFDPHQRGQSALERGDYETARRAYSQAIEAGRDLAVAYANRCYAEIALAHNDQALADCTKSLELAPEDIDPAVYRRWEVLNNRGVANLQHRNYEEAIADFTAALELSPDYVDAIANRGRAYAESEDYDAALEDLTRAIELNPELAEAFGNRGMAYESLGDVASAVADYTRAIELSADPQAYFNRAMLNYSEGHFDDAYEDFRATVARIDDPNSYLRFMAEQQADFLENRPKGFDPDATLTPAADMEATPTP